MVTRADRVAWVKFVQNDRNSERNESGRKLS